jgi:GntP family gluconate:H+ symporter
MAEGFIFLIMLGVFALTAFAFKFPVGVCMMLASIAGALSDGQGFALRHLVEGTFGYLPTMLVIASAMVLMKFIQKSGLLETVARGIIDKFSNMKALMLAGLTLLIMFPGMITGSSSACVLTTGTLVVPVLTYFGLPRQRAGAIIAMSAIFGMIAPPVNLPAMIIGAGIDMPYVGFFMPLLLATFPIAIITSLIIGLPYMMKKKEAGKIEDKSILPVSYYKQYGFKMMLPLLVLVVLMVLPNIFLGKFRDLGMPLVMIIAAVFATFTGKRFNVVKAAR